jgi:2-polyprenyl-3-methyl-5-hydroxy-6-metoxy-1,4-benzoquinol methylase
MDDPHCDAWMLDNTYRNFGVINALVSGWRATYRRRIRPFLSPTRESTALDVGCGGGDLAVALRRWAERDGLRLTVTGIDPDERAFAFASGRPATGGVRFRRASTGELLEAGERADFVVSNHVLHHLGDAERDALLADSAGFGARLVLHDDIERSRLAYAAWAVGALPFAVDSFALVDGLRSVRRSYRAPELAALAPGWRVERMFPWRLLLVKGTPASRNEAA